MIGFVIVIVWIIGWLTSYPRYKKYIKEEFQENYRHIDLKFEWTKLDMLKAIGTCFTFWYIVWIYYVLIWIDNIISDKDGWFQKKSKF